MDTTGDSMLSFYTSLVENGFDIHYKILIARDIHAEYMKLITQPPITSKAVFVYTTDADIIDLCREEESRMKNLKPDSRDINPDDVEAVFVWNQSVGFVYKTPVSEERWTRYFKMDPKGACLICTETGKRSRICANCGSIICIECNERVESLRCPGCTVEIC